MRILGFLGFTVLLGLLFKFYGGTILLVAIPVMLVISSLIKRHRRRLAPKLAEERLRQIMTDEVQQHLDTLARKRMQLLKRDDYGAIDAKAWTAEIARFLKSVVFSKMADEDLRLIDSGTIDRLATEIVEPAVYRQHGALDQELAYDDSMTPVMFEHYCAAVLQRAGWLCKVTQASGDQGVDVIATKGGAKVAVQCKKYSSPVGNSAVQEIAAARIHVGATAAVVVSTAGYTHSARELAATTRTLLLEHTDLLRIDEILRS